MEDGAEAFFERQERERLANLKRLEAEAIAAVERPEGAPKRDRREETVRQLLEAMRLAGERGVLDADFAVGILGRDELRPILAELAIDGKVIVGALEAEHPTQLWSDGTEPWLVRLAPAGTPSLEDRIIAALAEAGLWGLHVDSLHDECLAVLDELPAWEGRIDLLNELFLCARGGLEDRDVVADVGFGERYALTPAEWARRIVAEIASVQRAFGVTDAPIVVSAVERLLAGTEPDAIAPTDPAPVPSPAAPTLRTGERGA